MRIAQVASLFESVPPRVLAVQKPFCSSFQRKIDSRRKPLAHERFARAANWNPLLRADGWFQRFHTARVYGGTERIVSYLTEELFKLGHDVTLFASGDSVTTADLVSCAPYPT